MKAVIVAGGDADPVDRRALAGADVVIAADSGVHTLGAWEVIPDVVVGDLESLTMEQIEELHAAGATVVRHPFAKDETDSELAVREALDRGADELVVLGALGGARLDHELANLLLLASPLLVGRRARLQRGSVVARAITAGGRLEVEAPVGELVTLLPVGGDAVGVRTDGLRYPLVGETLTFGLPRGVSNVVAQPNAQVSLESGVLLVIEGARDL